jgi:hypothetical protein
MNFAACSMNSSYDTAAGRSVVHTASMLPFGITCHPTFLPRALNILLRVDVR